MCIRDSSVPASRERLYDSGGLFFSPSGSIQLYVRRPNTRYSKLQRSLKIHIFSGVLQHHQLYIIAHMLAGVGAVFHIIKDLAPGDNVDDVGAVLPDIQGGFQVQEDVYKRQAVVFGAGMFLIFSLDRTWAASEVNSVGISVFHTVFNILNTAFLYPFGNQLVKLSGILVKDHEKKEEEAEELEDISCELPHLDMRLLESPSFALEGAVKEVCLLYTSRCV